MDRKCDSFFARLYALCLAVTYGEVRLVTGYSEVLPKDVCLDSRFSRRVSMKIPVASAAMDTVTESTMAIAIAKLGGIGVLHRSLSPREQGDQARKVKYHLSGMMDNPVTVRETMTLDEVKKMRERRGFSFYTFPVVTKAGALIGLLTENDFDFNFEKSNKKISGIMTRELITAPPNISIEDAYKLMQAKKKKVLPLVRGRKLVGMYLFSDLKRIVLGHSGRYNLDSRGRLRVAAAVGTGNDAMKRLKCLHGDDGQPFVDVLVVETAHGDSKNVIETVRMLKKECDTMDVVAGNISTGESAVRLAEAGADGIKVGQGPGSICTTRIVAGVGRPQVSAIYSVAKALEDNNFSDIPICADGGIEHSGDIPIAIGAGAHTVMLGKLLAGTAESPGEVVRGIGDSGPMKLYYGMGSKRALEKSRAARDRYRQTDTGKDHLVPEGIEAAVPYVGSLEDVMRQYVGGLRSGMGYVGATTIEELRQKANFDRISGIGREESHPHGVRIMRDAPNYKEKK